ncbi:hypothetical protein ACQ4LE_010122 [Meloidogyne hapla]
MLGIDTIGSDIDLIIVLHENNDFAGIKKFFGTEKSICEGQKNIKCNDQSLYCLLCKLDKVKNIQKVNTNIPLIELNYLNIEIDIVLTLLPTKIPGNPNWIEKVLEDGKNLAIGDRNILPIASYKANQFILEKIPKEDLKTKNFRFAIIAMKIWAKKSSIYGNKFGLLSGTILSIIITKIYLLYPNINLHSLLQRIFLTFLTWNWPAIFRLNEIKLKEPGWKPTKEFLNRSELFNRLINIESKEWLNSNTQRLSEHTKLVVPIISSSFPEQSVAFNINNSTKQIIMETMIEGLKQLRNIYNAGQKKKSIKEFWEKWLLGIDFKLNYEHFIIIECAAHYKNIGDKFCTNVENRLRLQLIITLEEMPLLINYSHIGYSWTTQECKIRNKKTKNVKFNYCKYWLVGLKLVDDIQKINSEIKFSELMQERMEKFSKNILKANNIKKMNLKQLALNLFYEKREGLNKWIGLE